MDKTKKSAANESTSAENVRLSDLLCGTQPTPAEKHWAMHTAYHVLYDRYRELQRARTDTMKAEKLSYIRDRLIVLQSVMVNDLKMDVTFTKL